MPQLTLYTAPSKIIDLRNNLLKNAAYDSLLYNKYLNATTPEPAQGVLMSLREASAAGVLGNSCFSLIKILFLGLRLPERVPSLLTEVTLLLLPFCGYHEITLATNKPHSLIKMFLRHIFSLCHVPECITFQEYLLPEFHMSSGKPNSVLSQNVHFVPQVNPSWTSDGSTHFILCIYL